jgi:hypothetical protein
MARAVAAALAPHPDDRPASCDALLEMWCDDVPDDRVGAAWEGSHLALVRGLAPTSGHGKRVSVTIAPSLPSAPPVHTGPGPSLAPTVPQAAPSRAMGYTTARVAVGIGAAGIALAAGIVLVGAAVGGWLWMERADPAPRVVTVPVPAPVPPPAILEEEVVVAAAAVVPEPAPDPVKTPRPRPSMRPPAPPAPVAPADPVVTLQGIDRAWLVRSDGARFKPGAIPPGSYVVQAFFDEAQPTRVMELTVAPGDARTIRCDRALKVCR